MARIMKKNVGVETLSITFNFVNGDSYTADVSNYPEAIKDRLMLHGAAQKLGDSCAGKDDSEWLATIEALDKQLRNGDWGAERGSGLEEKLEAAEDRVAEYDRMTDDEKRAVAKLGVSRLALTKEVDKIKKAITKREEK